MTQRNLDRLNHLLQVHQKGLEMPSFRAVVHENMGNLFWLRKHIEPRIVRDERIPEKGELKDLILMDEKELRAVYLTPSQRAEQAAMKAKGVPAGVYVVEQDHSSMPVPPLRRQLAQIFGLPSADAQDYLRDDQKVSTGLQLRNYEPEEEENNERQE